MKEPLLPLADGPRLPSDALQAVDRAAQDELMAAFGALSDARRSRSSTMLSQALARVARCYREWGWVDVAEGYGQQALYWARPEAAFGEELELLRHLTDIAVAQALRDAMPCRDAAQPRASTGASDRPVWLPFATTSSGDPATTT